MEEGGEEVRAIGSYSICLLLSSSHLFPCLVMEQIVALFSLPDKKNIFLLLSLFPVEAEQNRVAEHMSNFWAPNFIYTEVHPHSQQTISGLAALKSS